MISKFFIERPVLSNVIALLMILIGGVALFNLAISQYPDVVPPTVQVTTRYPGASAKTVIDTVALPIEQQVNGVEDMLYMQSYSGADGTYTLTVTFKIGTDLNFAQVLVQNRVSSALAQLPQVVQNQGVTVQKRSTSILLFVTLTSPDAKYDSLYLSNYATINLRDELSRLPGVGNVTVFGAGQYSMRIWLDPNKLQARGLMPQDVIQAIQQQSQQVAAGQVGSPPTPPGQAFQYTLNVNGRLDDAGQFEDIIVKAGNNGDVTRVRDVGSVELGAQTYSQLFSLNKQPSTGIGVFQSPGANALEVEKAVEKKMTELARAFPQGIKYDTPFDTTKFVNASIHEVYKTLIEAGFLVLVVILVFLQDWRAMLVPATTVPVTIIGAFAAMAALDRTQKVLDKVAEIAGQTPGVAQVITIAGISALDNSASLANAGVGYIILKDWDSRGAGEDLRSLVYGLNDKLSIIQEARALVLPPPPIQGIGNAAGFAMQVELRDGNSDFSKLQAITQAMVANAQTQSALQRVQSPFRATVPQFDVEVDRIKTQTLHVTTDQVFSTLASYLGSSYVNQFNKFGRVFQVYAQADARFRLTERDIANMMVRNQNGDMIPIGTVARITPSVGPSLISLYNLYPSSTIVGLPAQGYSSGQSLNLMEQIADKTLPPGTGYEWTAMSYQEKAVTSQIYYVFGLAMLLVYLVLAGQYESWYAPISVILAVPLSLIGPMIVLEGLKIDNNLYVQIGLILLIALSAKNAILIVEVALELHVRDGKPILESAVEAARARFRPILMTSFAFILGVVPLVTATGAGASARKSIGITVFSGMLASTCLAVLFVPAFFVVVQRFENWRAAKKKMPATKPLSHAGS